MKPITHKSLRKGSEYKRFYFWYRNWPFLEGEELFVICLPFQNTEVRSQLKDYFFISHLCVIILYDSYSFDKNLHDSLNLYTLRLRLQRLWILISDYGILKLLCFSVEPLRRDLILFYSLAKITFLFIQIVLRLILPLIEFIFDVFIIFLLLILMINPESYLLICYLTEFLVFFTFILFLFLVIKGLM